MNLRSKLDHHRDALHAALGGYEAAAHPYYVVAPPFLRTSAGIKVLHLLCDALNHLGCEAYVAVHPAGLPNRVLSPDLDTPMLTREIAARHFRGRRTPVVIYPETVKGDPFAAPVICRYVLNYPGLLGGDAEYRPEEMVFGYSHRLAEAAGAADRVLFLPASDPAIFHPPATGGERSGACFYAAKYKDYHGGELFPATAGAFEITRDRPDSLAPAQIAELFRRSEVFYCYENTSLATEAAMCGCPAVFLPNEHLSEIIGSQELGTNGFAWGDAPEEVARARATVTHFYAHYMSVLDKFGAQLAQFVEDTQTRARATPFETPLDLSDYGPLLGPSLWRIYTSRAVHLVRTVGLTTMLIRASRYGLKLLLHPRQNY